MHKYMDFMNQENYNFAFELHLLKMFQILLLQMLAYI